VNEIDLPGYGPHEYPPEWDDEDEDMCTTCGEEPIRKDGLCPSCWEGGYADYKMDEYKESRLRDDE